MLVKHYFIETLLLISAIGAKSRAYAYKKCKSQVYCGGNLLHTVQMAKIFPDSKTFVDMKMKYPPEETLANFSEFMIAKDDKPSLDDLSEFLKHNFEPVGFELEKWSPTDWKERPKFVENIKDSELRTFALNLNKIWKTLGRKVKETVRQNQDLYSIIWVPNPLIVPGGRFREYYYWDSYWIIIGLLLSEMKTTARGMLENFLYLVETFGHIPNGGRVYYLERSQPPLLIPMTKLYLDSTGDEAFIKANIEIMEKEFDFWLKQHSMVITKAGKNYTLFRYVENSQGPRPESYSEDFNTVSKLPSIKKEILYSELKAAAESGWDFSSRWFIDENRTDGGDLMNLKTTAILPVDLNAILYWNAHILAHYNEMFGYELKASFYHKIANETKEAISAILWNQTNGVWFDYDMKNEIQRPYFYPSNLAPLWTECFDLKDIHQITEMVIKYLEDQSIMKYPGGIPSSLKLTGEQWDFPNVWPPLVYITVVALDNTKDKFAQRLAFQIAERWVNSNLLLFKNNSIMFEKYDARFFGTSGSGGEYVVQEGFGWTNGVILYLLNKYSDVLSATTSFDLESNSSDEISLTTPSILLLSCWIVQYFG